MAKWFWGLLSIGLLFLILGTGNLLVGSHRADHYRGLLRVAEAHAIAGDRQAGKTEFSLEMKKDALAHYQSLRQHYEYYQFCVVGGKYFLAISGCLFLAASVIGAFLRDSFRAVAPDSSP